MVLLLLFPRDGSRFGQHRSSNVVLVFTRAVQVLSQRRKIIQARTVDAAAVCTRTIAAAAIARVASATINMIVFQEMLAAAMVHTRGTHGPNGIDCL